MKIRRTVMSGIAAVTASAALALAGGPVLSPAPVLTSAQAHARGRGLSVTDYGFQGTAYATRVLSGAGVNATRTAFSYISCTRIAGRTATQPVVEGQINPALTLGVGESRTRTYKKRKRGIVAAITSTNKISQVKLGDSGSTPVLTINGLTTRSSAWATVAGALKTRNHVGAGKLTLTGISNPNDGSPLSQLMNALSQGIDQVVQTLIKNGGSIEIPGLGVLHVGFDKQTHRPGFAYASSFVLRVQLYGADGVSGGGDDSLVGIGRSFARINRDLPAAVMGGNAYGSSVSLAGGVLSVGRLGDQVLPCIGTHGVVRTSPTGSVNPGGSNQLKLNGVQGQSYGIQHQNGSAKAWTAGSVTDLTIGSLELRGIVGKAKIAQGRSGRITKRTFRGSTVGQVLVNGKKQGGISPGQASQIPADQLPPQVAKIELFKREKGKRALRITAVTITMAPGSPGPSVILIGSAKVRLDRY